MILFDIIVPTYRRYQDLPRFFSENVGLNRADVMIWIVDDGTPEPDTSVIPAWPNLRFIKMEKNSGQAHARNVAIEKGGAPIVISLDDDAWIEDAPAALRNIEAFFKDFQDTGCAMFNIATPQSPYINNRVRGTEQALHITCGCAYRRDVLQLVGNFSGFLHSGAEETDLSLRIVRAGKAIRFAPEVHVFHNFVPVSRPLSWYHHVRFHTARNDLLIVLMYYPGWLVIPFIFGKLASHLLFAIRHNVSIIRTFWVTLQAFGAFILMSPTAWAKRNSLTMKRFSYWRSLARNPR